VGCLTTESGQSIGRNRCAFDSRSSVLHELGRRCVTPGLAAGWKGSAVAKGLSGQDF
jgi:hypothetical protein